MFILFQLWQALVTCKEASLWKLLFTFELVAAGNKGTVKYCNKGDTEFVLGDLRFVVLTAAGVVESVDLTASVWLEFV